MYQSQSFQSANYRGNLPGQSTNLSSQSQLPSSVSSTQNVTSQYRGVQTSYQPAGFVSSVYGQTAGGTSFQAGQTGQTGQFGQAAQFANPSSEQYHTANYRGNQPGHDDYLRSDSIVPAQRQFGIGAQGFTGNVGGNVGGVSGMAGGNVGQGYAGNIGLRTGTGGISGMGTSFQAGQFGQAGQAGQLGQFGQTGQYANPVSQQYHAANYRGNQPGHDDYLRSDSIVPAQRQFGIGAQGVSGNVGGGFGGAAGTAGGVSGTLGGNIGGISGTAGGNIGRSFPSNIGGVSGQALGTAFGGGTTASYEGQSTIPSAQAYHTANYRGDQPGHDDYLRSDSIVPAQRQFGVGTQGLSGNIGSSFGTSSGFTGTK